MRVCSVRAVDAVCLPTLAAVSAVDLAALGALGAADDRPGTGGRPAGAALAVQLDHGACQPR
jgi:hypothetical protein